MNTTLLFGIHCHQPVDNFDYVIKNAIEKSYKPFFQTLKKYPQFKFSVHFSGYLFEFIEKNDPELFALIKSMSSQIEFFTGGFYEPVLASIPSKDRIGQIKKLSNYIKKHFNQTPKGLWLTERVWDNSIIKDLKECNIDYVMVDDYHLLSVGAKQDDTNGYYLTEESGETLALFPINEKLRYAIPFYDLKTTNELINSFKNIDGKNAAIIFDDGEKFGIWPKTYETVYEKKWLEEFIEQTLNDNNIKVQTFKEYYQSFKPQGLIYLPTVSYQEMGQWCLKSEDALKVQVLNDIEKELGYFIKGGTWKNFLNKYQEANWIQKRFLELSKKQINSVKYKEALYKAQCNDVLWHGVFGGIYLGNLRDNAYKYIIECEKLLGNLKETLDIDMDGYDEYKYNDGEILTIISSKSGAQIMELDSLNKEFNFLNTLTRYEENYHKKIVICNEKQEDEELKTIHHNQFILNDEIKIITDWYTKKSAIDHISKTINLQSFIDNNFNEIGDFANQPFDIVKNATDKLEFKRDGGIYLDKKYDSVLKKTYKFLKDTIKLELSFKTEYKEKLQYFNEWNLHFANIDDVTFNEQIIDEQMQYLSLKTNRLTMEDSYTKKQFIFDFDDLIDIYIIKVNTVSQNEEGLGVSNQGISLAFVYDIKQKFSTTIQLNIKDI